MAVQKLVTIAARPLGVRPDGSVVLLRSVSGRSAFGRTGWLVAMGFSYVLCRASAVGGGWRS